MTLRLYDTAARSVRDFVPRQAGKVGVYLCGLTLQAPPHIGHLRSGVNYDVLRRWLSAAGFEVTFIRNVTDIDDKILVKAQEQGRPFWSIAYANELVLARSYRALNVLPPTYEPRATGHIPEMHELIARLIETGHAYPATDGSGDVYFDVASWPAYGSLSGQSPDDMQSAGDAPERGKRDPGTSRCGRASSRTSRPTPTGPPRGVGAVPAGTSSARRCACVTSARSSTSTAAAST